MKHPLVMDDSMFCFFFFEDNEVVKQAKMN